MNRAAGLRERFVPIGAALMLLPLAGFGAPAAARAGDDAAAAAMPGIDTRAVLVPDGQLAGQAIRVSEVGSRLDPAQALDRVESHWRAQSDELVLRAEHAPWSVLSRRRADGFETLQLRATARGGSEGLLTVWQGREARPARPRALDGLLPAEARVTRQLASSDAAPDGARSADTLIAHLPHSIDEAERRIERQLARAGFAAALQQRRETGLAWRNDRARFFRSAGAEVLVTLHSQPDGTGVVIYHVATRR